MALLFVDGFDHYASADLAKKWNSYNSSTVGIEAAGRNSTNGLAIYHNAASGTFGIIKSFPSNSNQFIFGVAVAPNLDPNRGTRCMLHLNDASVTHLSVWITAAGRIDVYRGFGSTLLGSASVYLADDVYSYVEIKAAIHDTTGAVTVRVNGQSALTLTNIDTRNGGTTNWELVSLGANGAVAGSDRAFVFDDLYIADSSGSVNNDFLGPRRVITIFPTGAGASTDFTPSTGSNWQNVDDTSLDSDTTYNSESTPGDHDTYAFGNVGVTGSVAGIQHNLMVRSDGSGSETVRPKTRIGGVDYNGTTQALTTAYTDVREVVELSPATTSAWTTTEIDGAEFGIELVS